MSRCFSHSSRASPQLACTPFPGGVGPRCQALLPPTTRWEAKPGLSRGPHPAQEGTEHSPLMIPLGRHAALSPPLNRSLDHGERAGSQRCGHGDGAHTVFRKGDVFLLCLAVSLCLSLVNAHKACLNSLSSNSRTEFNSNALAAHDKALFSISPATVIRSGVNIQIFGEAV